MPEDFDPEQFLAEEDEEIEEWMWIQDEPNWNDEGFYE